LADITDSPHFHIHWSTTDQVDWQRFDTKAEADRRAVELVKPTESFTLEEFGANCPICERMRQSSQASTH
jgi:hypothetical protein